MEIAAWNLTKTCTSQLRWESQNNRRLRELNKLSRKRACVQFAVCNGEETCMWAFVVFFSSSIAAFKRFLCDANSNSLFFLLYNHHQRRCWTNNWGESLMSVSLKSIELDPCPYFIFLRDENWQQERESEREKSTKWSLNCALNEIEKRNTLCVCLVLVT
jgi:hypothetical protein